MWIWALISLGFLTGCNIYSFDNYLLSNFTVPDTVVSIGNKMMTK